jgi:hypothetical protein
VIKQIQQEFKETYWNNTEELARERARGVSRRFFYSCDFKPKHVTVAELQVAIAADIPTYVSYMATKKKEVREELQILVAATEMVSCHATEIAFKQSKKHKDAVWINFPALNFQLEMRLKGVNCATCGKVDEKEVRLCSICKSGKCDTCPSHNEMVCEYTRNQHKAFREKYYPTLLEPKDLQLCESCSDFEKPKLYCCKGAYYCNKECQVKDRKKHKSVCVRKNTKKAEISN